MTSTPPERLDGVAEESRGDPELVGIFRDEMHRHVRALARMEDGLAAQARSLHAMKGAAAMMGFTELAASLHDVDQAARAGDAVAVGVGLHALVPALAAYGIDAPDLSVVAAALAGGPQEPGTARSSSEFDLQGYFLAEARLRLEAVAEGLAALRGAGSEPAAKAVLDGVLRDVHALKGAAGIVGARAVARGAHALEGALASLRDRGEAPGRREVAVLGIARDRLALALGDAAGGADAVAGLITALREGGLLRDEDIAEASPGKTEGAVRGADVIRVPTQAVARLAEAVGEVGFVHDRMARHAGTVHDAARSLVRAGRAVEDALRRIGPARPWGAPADALRALVAVQATLADEEHALEREARGLRHDAELLGTLAGGARDALKGIGASTAGWLFDRVALVVDAAAGADKSVRLVREGESTEIDRGVAERLIEPLAQLVRNAVAHGVERPAQRMARGKPARATLRLAAEAHGELLRIVVEDDGAGIDLGAVRARAAALGLVPMSGKLSDVAVLEALFLPGVSTRETADASAGRGVGLDLVRQEVRLLGGVVRATSEQGAGARFEIELTPRPMAQRVVRVRAAGECVALPLARVLRVERRDTWPAATRKVSLSGLFGSRAVGGWVVALAVAGGEIGLEVETVEAPHEIVVRAMPAVLVGAGPWAAAAIDGEGTVTLVLDPDRLALTP